MLKEKYGEGFAHLGTLTYTGGKKAFKDAARIHGIGFDKANKISSLMPDIGCPPLDVLLEESDEIKALYNSDPEVKEVWDDAINLSDCLSAQGIHACLLAGTKVYIKKDENSQSELINIEDVKPGYFALTHKLRWKPVVEVQVNKAKRKDILHISYQCSEYDNFGYIECTSNHPIALIDSKEFKSEGYFNGDIVWVDAGNVNVGNGMIGVNGNDDILYARRVNDASKWTDIDPDGDIDVYNFTVLDDSSYIANGVVVHNCGVALSDRPLWEDVPLWDSKGAPVIQWEGNKIEDTSNVVKLDVLGLKTLTVLNFARELIKKRHGIDIDWYNLPMDNEAAYKVLWNERNYGIFQFEEAGMSGFVNACKPKTIHDIAVIVSTYRPGPLNIPGLVQRIIGKISGELPPTKFRFPKYDHIFSNAHNELIFQEGFLRLSKEMCGFSDIKADVLRKAVGKKDAAKLASLREDFINGAVANGEDKQEVAQFWEELLEFARYAFNASNLFY